MSVTFSASANATPASGTIVATCVVNSENYQLVILAGVDGQPFGGAASPLHVAAVNGLSASLSGGVASAIQGAPQTNYANSWLTSLTDGTDRVAVDSASRLLTAASIVNSPSVVVVSALASPVFVSATNAAGSAAGSPLFVSACVTNAAGSAAGSPLFVSVTNQVSASISNAVTVAQGASGASPWGVRVLDAAGNAYGVGAGSPLYITGGAAGGTSATDKAVYAEGTTSFTPVGGLFLNNPVALTASQSGAMRITANRGLHANLRDSSGNELGTGTASPLFVSVANLAGSAAGSPVFSSITNLAGSAAGSPLFASITNTVSASITSGSLAILSVPYAQSVGNSSSATLAAGASFIGTPESVLPYGQINIGVYTPESGCTNGLEFQFSTASDGTFRTLDTYSYVASAVRTFSLAPTLPWFRVKYVNGASAQTAFFISTAYRTTYVKPSSHRIDDTITGENDAELVKAVLTAKSTTGSFVNATTTALGNLKVSIEEASGLSIINRAGSAAGSPLFMSVTNLAGSAAGSPLFTRLSDGTDTAFVDAASRLAVALTDGANAYGLAGSPLPTVPVINQMYYGGSLLSVNLADISASLSGCTPIVASLNGFATVVVGATFTTSSCQFIGWAACGNNGGASATVQTRMPFGTNGGMTEADLLWQVPSGSGLVLTTTSACVVAGRLKYLRVAS